jgi:hypothetical protein
MDLLQARDENDDPLTNSERPYSAKRINKNKAPASSASSSKTGQHRAEVTKNDYKRRQHEKAEWLWSQRRPIIGTVGGALFVRSRILRSDTTDNRVFAGTRPLPTGIDRGLRHAGGT